MFHHWGKILQLKRFLVLFLLALFILPSCSYENLKRPYEGKNSPANGLDENDVIELTIATIRHPKDIWGMDNDLQLAAASFNRINPFCQIKIVDYLEDGETNTDNALRRLYSDIISGNYPDMICFSQISPYPFIAKNLLIDMDKCIATDSSITPDDIVSIQALRSLGGLFLLGSNVTADTLIAQFSRFGSRYGWTLQEYLNLESSCSPDTWIVYNITRETFLKSVAQRYTRTAINWENGTCDFTNKDFVEILLASSRIRDYQIDKNNTLSGYTGALVAQGNLITAVSLTDQVYAFARDEMNAGEKLSYIGWPTVDGSCGTDIRFQHPVGIISKSKHIEECWAFVKFLLQEHTINYGIPIYMPRLLAEIESAQDSKDRIPRMTSDQAQRFLDLLDHIENIAIYDDVVIDIIMSESKDFFAGYKTAEDTAMNIQAKISLYVSEQQ